MRLFRQPYTEISDEEAFRNAQPRRGVQGFFETLVDYFFVLVRANLLLACCLAPTLILYIVARMLIRNVFFVSIVSLLGAFLAGAALCGLNAVVCECIRNRGFVFFEVFKRHFRENLLRGILPGILYILTLECTLYLLSFNKVLAELDNGAVIVVMVCIFIAVTRLLLAYMLPMMTLIELPLRHYVRNSMLLIPACPKASLGILITTSILYLLTVLFLPYTGIYVVLLAFGLHTLIGQLWSWPMLNKTLAIEEREKQNKMHKEAIDENLN